MSNSVNDELEQLLDEWIESIMREVRKAREARLAEIRQEVAAISARLDALEQEFEERRRARNGMQATTEHEARTGRNYTTGEIKILSRKNTEVKDK